MPTKPVHGLNLAVNVINVAQTLQATNLRPCFFSSVSDIVKRTVPMTDNLSQPSQLFSQLKWDFIFDFGQNYVILTEVRYNRSMAKDVYCQVFQHVLQLKAKSMVTANVK
jgi:hypothetical protein